MKRLASVMVTIFLLTGSVVRAEENGWSAGDTILSALSGQAGFVAGAFVGGLIGGALAGSCHDDGSDERIFGPCFMHGFGEAIIGGMIGGTLGNAVGVYVYGQTTGYESSFATTLVGSAVGAASGVGLVALGGATDSDVGQIAFLGTALLANAVGPVVGYYLALEEDLPPVPQTSLINYTTETGFRLGVPQLNYTSTKDYGDTYHVKLLGGTF